MTLLNIIINAIKTKWSVIRNIIIISLMVITLISSSVAYYLFNQNKKLDYNIGLEISNRKQYESLYSNTVNDNRLLRLNISDLSHSKDSLVQSLQKTRDSLKIKDNELKQAMSVKTIIRDTIVGNLPDTTKTVVNFTIKLEPNTQTTFTITRKDSLITCIPEIYNTQELFTYSKKEYRNPDKNFFQRLFTWDWKKDVIERYNIINSNPLIQVTDTRVIKIKE